MLLLYTTGLPLQAPTEGGNVGPPLLTDMVIPPDNRLQLALCCPKSSYLVTLRPLIGSFRPGIGKNADKRPTIAPQASAKGPNVPGCCFHMAPGATNALSPLVGWRRGTVCSNLEIGWLGIFADRGLELGASSAFLPIPLPIKRKLSFTA